MSSEQKLHHQLEKLASETSSEARRALMNQLADMFFEQSLDHQQASGELFGDVVGIVVEAVEGRARAELSERMADKEMAPRSLVLKLADDDEIYVSSPILKKSPVLRDEDLVQIASSKGDAHLMAISQRPTLAPMVTDVLVDRGSDQVVHKVTQNNGAQFSNNGFSKLVDRAKLDENLQIALVERKDLPSQVIESLEPIVSDKLKEQLKKMQLAMSDAELRNYTSMAKTQLLTQMQAKSRARDPHTLYRFVQAGRLNAEQAFLEICISDRILDVATLFGLMLNLNIDVCVNILAGKNDEAVIVLAKACEMTLPAFHEVMRLRERKQTNHKMDLNAVMNEFEAMKVENAQRLVRFLSAKEMAAKSAN